MAHEFFSADVVELEDTYGLGPYGETLGGSTPSVRIILCELCGGNSAVECLLAKQDGAGSSPARRLLLRR